MDIYTTFQYKNKLEAKNAYLDLLKENPMFESIQLAVGYSKYNSVTSNSRKELNPDHFPPKCIVAIKPKEIIIADEARNELKRMPFHTIASWAVNTDTFVLVGKYININLFFIYKNLEYLWKKLKLFVEVVVVKIVLD